MIPEAPSALRMLSQRMLSHLLPDVKTTYAMSDGMMVGMLMSSLAKELDDGIERRLADIRDMQAIFDSARAELPTKLLPADLAAVLEQSPASMSMADVNAVHDSHTRVLIGLHDLVDVASPDAAQQKVNRAIWSYLRVHAQRHTLDA